VRSGADVLWFVFSLGGIITALVVTGAWALASRRSRRPRAALAAIVVFYVIAGWYPLSRYVSEQIGKPFARALTADDVPKGRTTVILLGSGSYTLADWRGNTVSIPDPIGIERTLEAVRVFKLLGATHLVSSGGRVFDDDPDQPAAVSMRTILEWLGVPADRVVVEQESRNTHDEALAVKKVLPSLGAEQVIVVTSPIHMRRSLAAFRAVGLRAYPAAARELRYGGDLALRLLPSNEGLRESALAAHELVGYLYYQARGWI
jgi:uncharacterized SAM-binding protein YcdF (DUF218 family)